MHFLGDNATTKLTLLLLVRSKLVSGSLPAPIYLSYLMGLLEIYIALEDALDEHTSHPHLASVYDSTLARANSLRSDIAYFIDEGVEPMQDFHQEDTAVDDYVRRLTQLGEEDGVEATLLLAHTYVRYRESCNRNTFRESNRY